MAVAVGNCCAGVAVGNSPVVAADSSAGFSPDSPAGSAAAGAASCAEDSAVAAATAAAVGVCSALVTGASDCDTEPAIGSGVQQSLPRQDRHQHALLPGE